MAEAVPIRPGLVPTLDAKVNPAVIAELEGLLAAARSGEIIGIAYACEHPAHLTTFHYAGETTRSTIGAVALLQHRMCKFAVEDH